MAVRRLSLWIAVFLPGICLFVLTSSGPTARTAEPELKAGPKSADAPGQAFLTQHCKACHTGDKPKGKFKLENLTADFNDKANREKWLAALEQVKSGNMPPEGKPRPAEKDVAALAGWINGRVAAAESARNASQGRVPLRRLNRAEYENTVRDLLGVDLDLKELLPPDTVVNGFDNGAEALHVSSFLMEQYLEAADKVLDAAIVNGPKP
jgi:mono/diheme cytochrome c family protein